MGRCCIPSNFFSNLYFHLKLKNIHIIKSGPFSSIISTPKCEIKTFGYFNLTLKNRIWSHSFLRLMHKSTACKMASMLHHVTCYCLVIFFTSGNHQLFLKSPTWVKFQYPSFKLTLTQVHGSTLWKKLQAIFNVIQKNQPKISTCLISSASPKWLVIFLVQKAIDMLCSSL